ncbi:MAG: hypothetical protein Q9224_002943, partial [Gallowayella concinna]
VTERLRVEFGKTHLGLHFGSGPVRQRFLADLFALGVVGLDEDITGRGQANHVFYSRGDGGVVHATESEGLARGRDGDLDGALSDLTGKAEDSALGS